MFEAIRACWVKLGALGALFEAQEANSEVSGAKSEAPRFKFEVQEGPKCLVQILWKFKKKMFLKRRVLLIPYALKYKV